MTGQPAPTGTPPGARETDRLVSFLLPHRDARGRVVRLGPALEQVLAAHAYPTPIRNLLADALVLTALMGTLRKEEHSQFTLQAQTEGGVVELLVCDYRDGALRGYVRHDPSRVDDLGPSPSLSALFGKGYLAITFDLATSGERYQGVVPLEGASLAEACERYFAQSEQVPTVIRLGRGMVDGHIYAGGLLVQHMPPVGESKLGEAPQAPPEPGADWQHVAIMSGSIRPGELSDPALPLTQVLWRLFHEEREVRVLDEEALTRGCRCTAEYYRSVLAKFPEDERVAMRNDDGIIAVDCAFCSKIFEIDL